MIFEREDKSSVLIPVSLAINSNISFSVCSADAGLVNPFKLVIIRSFISEAALLVKVIASISTNFFGDLLAKQIFKYSFTSVKVFPDPAEALYILKGIFSIGTSLGKHIDNC